MAQHLDTIFALSSGRPPAAIAVVRLSGPLAGQALEKLTGRLPQPRQASLARLRDPMNGEMIDEALALWFPAPRSETGEDMAEFQLHGGRAVIAAVTAALGRMKGFRPAEPGEFTRRAFENGRLDLTAVEGLADLIGAETEAQRRQAFRQLKGMLGERAETWRTRLIEASALVEARIDFSDEGDVPEDLLRPALAIARSLHEEISAVLAEPGRGERLRDGLVVAIAGPPNAGKSTLLNLIAKREAAIVSPFAGTTRDVIEVHLDLAGYPVTLLDTAGVRETDDPVEREGVRRARERAASADLVLWVTEAGRPLAGWEPADGSMAGSVAGSSSAGQPLDASAAIAPAVGTAARPGAQRDEVTRSLADKAGAKPGPMADLSGPLAELARTTPVWLIRNKADLLTETEPEQPLADQAGGLSPGHSKESDRACRIGHAFAGPGSTDASVAAQSAVTRSAVAQSPVAQSGATQSGVAQSATSPAPETAPAIKYESKIIDESEFIFTISARTGSGIADLLTVLAAHVQGFFGAETGVITRQRHRWALQEAEQALARALVESPPREEILAEELRLASRALGRLTGKVDVEDILDVIFRDFCIGK